MPFYRGVQRYEVMEHMVIKCVLLNFRGDHPPPLQLVPTNHFVPSKFFPYHPVLQYLLAQNRRSKGTKCLSIWVLTDWSPNFIGTT